MAFTLFDIISPHYCISCGEIGRILCEYCKYDIIEDGFGQCVICRNITSNNSSLCGGCTTFYSKAWSVGERSGVLKSLLDDFKFNRVRAAGQALAGLLDQSLPSLPVDTLATYVTTISPHVRQRGYDHARLIAQEVAKRRGLKLQRILERRQNTRQLGASRQERVENAKNAFTVNRQLDGRTVLLIDDIVTTGSTLEYASRALLDAGAGEVWVGVIARQPLEK